MNPAGKITIGSTITVLYALTIVGGQARFVGVDAAKLPQSILSKLKTGINPGQSNERFGFMVRDSRQPTLAIQINPHFMADVKGKLSVLQNKMARQGNLNLTIAPYKNGVKILQVVLD